MGGGAATGAGLGIMGGILGGIGDIISAQKYEPPKLPLPGEPERNLRRLAQNQLTAGGMQTLGGTALYNQMVPTLMGMLPGMTYHPGTESLGGTAETAGGGGGGGGGLDSYQQTVANYQQRQALADQVNALKRQKKAAKGAKRKDERKGIQAQLKEANQKLKRLPTSQDVNRQMYTAGVQQPNMDIYNIQSGAPASAPSFDVDGLGTSLGAIRGLMDAQSGSAPDLAALYRGGGFTGGGGGGLSGGY